jgi:hypothetical protein
MNLKAFLAAAVVAIAPAVAGAVTVVDSDVDAVPMVSNATYATSQDMGAGDYTAMFNFDSTAGKSDSVEWLIVVSGVTGDLPMLELTDDMGNVVTPTITMPMGGAFTEFSWMGTGVAGPSFSLNLNSDDLMVNAQLSYIATPVPLPAAGWMFISALAGMGFLARRRAAA